MPRSEATRLMSLAVAACLGIAVVPGSSIGQSLALDSTRPVTLPYSEEHTLVSKLNGREYRISVALPFSYHVGQATDTVRYPVLYLLDGDMSLPLFAGMFRLTNRGPSGDLILVGIGYPPGADPGLPAPGGGRPPYRLMDYTPPAYPASDSVNAALQKEFPGSVGAEVFLQVLKQEIIPFIELHYRTTDDRGIHGHSYGGLFAAYVLLTDPDLFLRYSIASPSLWWDNQSIFAREAAFARRTTSLSKTVFISVGSKEPLTMISTMWRFALALCQGVWEGSYKGLEVIVTTNEDERHTSPVHFARALQALYPADSTLAPPAERWCGNPAPWR